MKQKQQVRDAVFFFKKDWFIFGVNENNAIRHGTTLINEVQRLRRELKKSNKSLERLSLAIKKPPPVSDEWVKPFKTEEGTPYPQSEPYPL